jgi:hypothetical protein
MSFFTLFLPRYEDVYFKIFKHLKWQRAAAITEDGQKYTEYITRMEQNDTIKILVNKKIPRESGRQADRFEKVTYFICRYVHKFSVS